MSTQQRPLLRFGLWYDFRNPPQWKRSYDQIYSEIFEQIAWAEQHGFDDVWLSEHHFIEDGYSPSLLPIAAAIAARTKKIRIGTSVVLLPFQNPVRIAEEYCIGRCGAVQVPPVAAPKTGSAPRRGRRVRRLQRISSSPFNLSLIALASVSFRSAKVYV